MAKETQAPSLATRFAAVRKAVETAQAALDKAMTAQASIAKEIYDTKGNAQFELDGMRYSVMPRQRTKENEKGEKVPDGEPTFIVRTHGSQTVGSL